jgi:hypothetical protein
MQQSAKLNGPDDFDKYILAEILDEKSILFSTNWSANT